MKKDKRTFVFHLDWADVLNQQPDNIRLAVYDAIIDYVNNGNVPDAGTPVHLVFLFIKQQIDKDMERYEEVCEKRRKAGSKGGKQKVANVANATKCYQMQTSVADNDNEYDNDNDYDIIINDNSIIKEKINKKENEIENKIEPAKETTTLIDQNEKEKEKSCAKKEKKVRHKYGEYGHVLLSDEETQKLKDKYGEEAMQIITYFDELKEMKGYNYKNDYLAILKWGADSYRNKSNSHTYISNQNSESNNRLLDGIWDR